MEVEVVAGQVGETAHSEPDAVGAAEFEGVAGDLHHGGVDALLGHHGQQRLQRRGFRGGQCAGDVLPGDPDTDGADESRDAVGRSQARLDQVGGGRLAGGSGDADDHHTV